MICRRILFNRTVKIRNTHNYKQEIFASSISGGSDEGFLYGGGWNEGPRAVKVAVWWDFEDCDIPVGVPATKVGNNIVSALRLRGFKGPVSITAYGDILQLSRSTQEALTCTGISLHHLPSHRKNASSDRTLMVDMVLWTMDHPPPAHLFIISTDSDLSSALHSLRMKNYNVLLACNSHEASPALLAAATSVWQWGKLARGEGLVAQITVSYQNSRGAIQDPIPQTPPAHTNQHINNSHTNSPHTPSYTYPPQDSSYCSVLTNTPSYINRPHVNTLPNIPPSHVKPSSTTTPREKQDIPPMEDCISDKVRLDVFHKDVCDLLQQAASSITKKAQEPEQHAEEVKTEVTNGLNSTEISLEKHDEEVKMEGADVETMNVSVEEVNVQEDTEKVSESESSESTKWTWRKFFFGYHRKNPSDGNEDVDDTHIKIKQEIIQTQGHSEKRSWFSPLWKRKQSDESEKVWEDLKSYIHTADASEIISKAQNMKEFRDLLSANGPSWIQRHELGKVDELIERLICEKEIDTSHWQSENPPQQEASQEGDEQQCIWVKGQQNGHNPTVEELKIWLVYFLDVEQERRSFDASLLKQEFKRHFGVSLNLSTFNCVRIKDLFSLMQDTIQMHYPKPSLCTVRTKGMFKETKVRTLSMNDYRQMLEELLVEYPEGIPLSMIKPRFYDMFNYDINHEKFGYARLDEFIRAAHEDIYAKLHTQEQSLYVCFKTHEENNIDKEVFSENFQVGTSHR